MMWEWIKRSYFWRVRRRQDGGISGQGIHPGSTFVRHWWWKLLVFHWSSYRRGPSPRVSLEGRRLCRACVIEVGWGSALGREHVTGRLGVATLAWILRLGREIEKRFYISLLRKPEMTYCQDSYWKVRRILTR